MGVALSVFTRDDIVEAVRSSLEQGGWLSLGAIGPDDVADIAAGMLELAAAWGPGTVIERRLDDIHPRALGTDEPG